MATKKLTIEKNMKEHGEGCMCTMCGVGFGSQHFMHVIIRVLLVLFVFWCGMQLGELKAMIRSAYNQPYGFEMMTTRGVPAQFYGTPQMMTGISSGSVTLEVASSTPAKKK